MHHLYTDLHHEYDKLLLYIEGSQAYHSTSVSMSCSEYVEKSNIMYSVEVERELEEDLAGILN